MSIKLGRIDLDGMSMYTEARSALIKTTRLHGLEC